MLVMASVKCVRSASTHVAFIMVMHALALELAARGIRLERQLAMPILYRGSEVGLHRLDLLVAALIVVELKAVKTQARHCLPTAIP
jgi:GxxExxY protein